MHANDDDDAVDLGQQKPLRALALLTQVWATCSCVPARPVYALGFASFLLPSRPQQPTRKKSKKQARQQQKRVDDPTRRFLSVLPTSCTTSVPCVVVWANGKGKGALVCVLSH
jgi:hypothetical protein